jgi:hypothetical protein
MDIIREIKWQGWVGLALFTLVAIAWGLTHYRHH